MKTTLTILSVLLTTPLAFSQWSTNSTANNPVCTDYYVQNGIKMIPDGSGGAIIAWTDYRLPRYSIFVQRINANGSNQWTNNGVQIAPASSSGINSSITTDGHGGAIIVWGTGGQFGSVYAQRIASNGIIQWATNGVVICSATATEQWGPDIAADGSGGAVIAWNDSRNNVAGNDDDVYAQRVDSGGVTQWTANGVAVAAANGYQGSLRLTSDGSDGAIIAWQDTRNGTVDVYAQKVNGAGGMQWTTNGVAVASASGGVDRYLQLIGDAGGAIICWQDRRNGTDLNIYGQKLNSGGTEQWTANGVTACSAANNQQYPQLTTDGSGGAILTWQDNRAGPGPADVYAQRINSGGAAVWTADGQPICALSGAQSLPQIASDGSGGAVIAWMDGRIPTTPNDIYAQRIAADGTALWTTNGVGVSTAPQNQGHPFIINDGFNGMIVSWEDNRYDINRNDIFAQRLNPDGTLGRMVPMILSTPLRPDANRFQFTISGTAGQTYVIQASGNLTNWSAIATNVAPSDTFNYTNSTATNLLQFYRIKQGL